MEATEEPQVVVMAPRINENKAGCLHYQCQYALDLIARVARNYSVEVCQLEPDFSTTVSEPVICVFRHKHHKTDEKIGMAIDVGIRLLMPVMVTTLSQEFWDKTCRNLCCDVRRVMKEIKSEQHCKN